MPRLFDRLARLEAVHADQTRDAAPPGMLGTLISACAIALGGYPLPSHPWPSRFMDSPSDGFARALGFADDEDLREQIEAHPNLWGKRFDLAITAMFRTQGVGREAAGEAEQFRALVRILGSVSKDRGWIGARNAQATVDD
ncbi:hypothetical protein M446_0804 [Methylobacterium sp. 4-46]|nr:hypothetical protein M446_0804 [Methylobacterium sp. 4-46]